MFAGKGVLKQGALLIPLAYPQGSITGNLSCFPGSQIRVALQANASYESPVELQFFLSAGKGGSPLSQAPAGSGMVRQIWVGSAYLPCPQSPGEYLLRLQDQFGRSYAAARLVSRNLTITPHSYSEGAYSFDVLLDGSPLDASLAKVRIAGSNNSETYPVMQGRATVFAKPARSGTFIFELVGEDGAVASVPFSSPASSASIYLWLGLPGLALVFLLYYAITGRIGRKYTLLIDDSAPPAPGGLELDSASVQRIFEKTSRSLSIGRQPISFQEVMLGFRRHAVPNRAAFIADFGLQQLLDDFCSAKILQSHDGHYWPSSWRIPNPSYSVLSRRIRNELLHRGFRYRATVHGIYASTPLGHALIMPHQKGSSRKKLLFAPHPAGARKLLVFETAAEREDFRSSLLSGSQEDAMLSLAIRSQSILLVTIDSLGDAL